MVRHLMVSGRILDVALEGDPVLDNGTWDEVFTLHDCGNESADYRISSLTIELMTVTGLLISATVAFPAC